MKYDVTKGGYILLGRCGENLARTVEIDVSEYLKEFPGAVVTLLHRRHGESGIYPVAAELRDGCLVWQPTSADTAIVGDGEAEVRVTVNGVLAKSKILSTMVDKSLTGQETDAPEPGMDWVDKITTAIGSVQNMKAEAESVAYGEPATAEYDGKTGTMHFGIPEGRPGRDGAPGAKGDKGDPGSDASVTAENIETALGYAPVRDVQVAGSSVLDGGVANVPVASESAFGAVKVFDWGGTLIDSNKRLCVFPSTSNHISNRQSRTVIVPENLDTAVKAAMCDGKGAAWTSAEQAAARSRMGLDKGFELIETITINEEIGVIGRSTEPDGTAYIFKSLKILLTGMNTAGKNVFYEVTSDKLNQKKVCVGQVSGTQPSYNSLFEIECNGRLIIGRGSVAPGFSIQQATMSNTLLAAAQDFWPSGKIEGFILRLQTEGALLAVGTTIRIYGVRA